MTSSSTITTLFVDMGKVLLSDSWGPARRQRAGDLFGFDLEAAAARSQLTFEVYEQGKISLDEFVNWVIISQGHAIDREAFKEFMLDQSHPHPDMIELVRRLKALYGLKVVMVTNDGREFILRRIQHFGLAEFVDCFIVSCFVGCRKPDPDIYRMALDITQAQPSQVVYIDDQVLFVEVAQSLGIRGIHHTDYASTRAALVEFGLSLVP
jgi:putative hydrolase of the HAD superfamily